MKSDELSLPDYDEVFRDEDEDVSHFPQC